MRPAIACERVVSVTRASEHKNGATPCTLMATLLVVALLACTLPVCTANERARADEVGDELVSGMQGADAIGDSQGAGKDEPGDEDVGLSPSGPDGASGVEAPSEDERRSIEDLESLGVRLDRDFAELEASKTAFDTARILFARGAFARDAVIGIGGEVSEHIERLDRSRRNSLALIKAVQDELMQSADYGTAALISGEVSSRDIELRQELLERLMVAESKKLRQMLGDERRLRVELALDAASSSHARRELRTSILPISMAAYRVERSCARVRQIAKDIQVATGKSSDAHPAFLEAGHAILSRADAALGLVDSVEQAVGAWYDELDARAGVQGALSFGEGIDFACDEDAFVDRWGAAIDAFLEECSKTMGALPLQGYGCKMAASAYRHKVDPRLCAAVSIAESGGGQNCIRACNAWGWGAADSDPYGLAAEWSSFEEAIEAWHEGMATSTSGLAGAVTVSALGSIYCSSPAWGSTVIEQMELISSFA